MVKRDSFLLVSSDFHFRSSSRSVTLDLLWYRCLTDLAPLRWTISMLLMSTLSCGSQTQLANSTVGLTIDMYAVSWSVRFGQLLRCAHKRIVNILYNESVHGKEEQVT